MTPQTIHGDDGLVHYIETVRPTHDRRDNAPWYVCGGRSPQYRRRRSDEVATCLRCVVKQWAWDAMITRVQRHPKIRYDE